MHNSKSNLYLICVLVLLVLASGFYLYAHPEQNNNTAKGPRPCAIEGLHIAAPVPVALKTDAGKWPLLTWKITPEAAAYEIELFTDNPAQNKTKPFLTTKRIYINGFIPALPASFQNNNFWWHVRALNYYAEPISDFSEPAQVVLHKAETDLLRPIPMSKFNSGNGTVLLYPVYLWIPIPGAAKYEIEILDAPPENPSGIEPSQHRIDVASDKGFDHYDTTARFGTKPFYWRVRGLTEDGNPVGVYSEAQKFTTNPEDNYKVATLGDSITHGGGSFSYAPSNWDFSFQYYLKFPTVNLGESGDTSGSSLARFDSDVLPFHPKYLLIMTGSNSLRSTSYSAEGVIIELQGLKAKCEEHNITPIFITLPAINPANIKQAFDEKTDPAWQMKFAKVNSYIRSQKYIDAAAYFKTPDGILPTKMALDGLHLDIEGKKLIGQAINENFTPQ
jgi:lysophospholipase L1-like esterase